MLDIAALIAEENRSALIGAGCAGAAGAGSEEGTGASRLPEAQRGTEPDNPATCKQRSDLLAARWTIPRLWYHEIYHGSTCTVGHGPGGCSLEVNDSRERSLLT